MVKPIRVLIVEDSEDDAMLIILTLKREGYNPYYKIIDTKKDLEYLLDNEKWDIVISDYSMPKFSGPEVLEIIKKKNINLPFIVISGAIGEDVAVEMMKKGADDYIMKDNLKRLTASIEREIKEAEIKNSKRKTEHDLREAYNIINKSSSIAFLWKNTKGWPVEFVTENVQKIFGYTAKELITTNQLYANIIHPDDLKRVKKEISDCCNDIEAISFTHEPYRIITKSGEIKWVEDKKEIRKNKNGSITHYQGIIEDITNHIKMLKDLIESEERYRMLFNNAVEGIVVIDNETKKFLYVNPAICMLLGYTEKELLCLSVLDIHPKEYLLYALSEFEEHKKEEKNLSLDIPCLKKNGEIIYVEIRSSIVTFNNRICTISFFTDITGRKKAEEEIKSLSKFPSENPNPVLRVNKHGILLYANNAALSQLSKWNLKTGFIVPEVLNELIKEAFSKIKISDKEITLGDSTFLISISTSKEMEYVNIYARDITDRKIAEKILRESEKKYRELVENINDWVWITNQKGIYLYSSSKVNDILGYEVTDIIGKSFFELMPKKEGNIFYKEFQNIVKKKIAFFRIVVKTLHKNGSIKILEKSGTPFFDKQGNLIGYRGIDRDLTKQKNLEQQLFQAQKMESIGLLAGGIAHDFNNLLMAIMSYCKIMELKIEDDSPLNEYLFEITDVCKKATNLTQNLLVFSRKQAIDLNPIKLNKLISEIKKTLLHIIREDIKLKTILSKNEINVIADSNAINQVLLNLATNASDAMPNGGRLVIKTEIIDINKDFMNSHGFGKPGKYALISVSDTGIGMEKNVYEKIFDPFFTTKEVGKGTGLGLSVSYGIIKQHNGYINVYSEKEEGTTFKIYLPLTQSKSKKTENIKEDFSKLKGHETILVVEDEQEVRESLKVILEDIGYNIILAIDGKDAIEKFKKNNDKINLVILDLIIPKFDGRNVYENIKFLDPELKFIFMSGYTVETIKNKDFSNEEVDFISKPIMPDKLLKKIREVLDK